MLVLKLILERVRMALLNELSYRLRYYIGFLFLVLILLLLKVTVAWFIDVKYWDELKSGQFTTFEKQK
jgi:hypothetical protein